MSDFRGFVVGAQYGGPHTGVDDEIPLLRSIVASHMTLTRAKEVESIQMVFRVDGRVVAYNCAKAEKLKLMRRYKEAWVDLGVPMSAYEGRSVAEIRQYLCDCVEAALEMLVARFKKDKICDGCELLYGDWERAKAQYLAQA